MDTSSKPRGFYGWLQRFFDKTRGRQTNIDEFPFLFFLQSYAGWSAIGLGVLWFGFLEGWHSGYFNKITVGFMALAGIGFAALSILSIIFAQAVVYADESRTGEQWDYYARLRMTICLVLFAASCSILIWVTGGTLSPFIPFYIMVFTLALTRCDVPHPGRALLLLFAIPFAISAGLAAFFPDYIDHTVTKDVQNSLAKPYFDFAFAMMSMLVPYGSTWYAAKWAAKAKKAAERRGASSSRSTITNPSDQIDPVQPAVIEDRRLYAGPQSSTGSEQNGV